MIFSEWRSAMRLSVVILVFVLIVWVMIDSFF